MILLLATLVDLACTINETYWLWRFVDLFFEGRTFRRKTEEWFYGRRKHLLRGILISAPVTVTMVLNQITLVSSYTTIGLYVLCTLMVYAFWKCDFISAAAAAGVYFFIIAIFGGIEVSLTGIIGGETLIYQATAEQGWVKILYLLICGSVWFLFCFSLFSKMSKWKKMRSHMKSFAYISVLWWLGYTFIFQQMLSNFNVYLSVAWYLFLGITFGTLCNVYTLVKGRQMQKKIQILDA